MFELFFCGLLLQDKTTGILRMAVLDTSECKTQDEIPALATTHAQRYILARNTETGEKLVFDVIREKFITPTCKDIRLAKVGHCGRCSGTGIYQGPSGANYSVRLRGGYRANMPVCFDCNGAGHMA
jgi:hypothetical protein